MDLSPQFSLFLCHGYTKAYIVENIPRELSSNGLLGAGMEK